MLTKLDDYQLEWHPEQGLQCRYKLLSEAAWSGWMPLGASDLPLVSLLLSQQPVFYNQLTGALSVGATEAAEPDSSAAFFSESRPVVSPNSGDDAEAAQELEPVADANAQAAATGVRPWRTARSLLVLRDQLNRLYPLCNKASDGTIADINHLGTSDHQPNILDEGMGVVTALDITHDPAHGCDAQRVVDALVASRDPRIKYIIWNRHIANSAPIADAAAWAWRPYTGQNPHNHHFHLSVKAAKAAYDSVLNWQLA